MSGLQTMTERLDLGGRMAVPYFFVGLLFVLNIVSLSYPFTGGIKVPFILMALYYWSIFRPTMIPGWLAFAIGIVLDLLSGLPVGINASIFVVLQWVVSDQRRFLMGQPFIMIWSGFGLVAAISSFLQWFLFGLSTLHWPSIVPVGISFVLGFVLFPVVCLLFHFTHKILPVKSGDFISQNQTGLVR